MSPPRRIYGPRPPGRLQATMLKVLAAELSDAGRLGRGKRYFNDGAVTDIDIAPGIVQGVVQGSRSDPYVASVVTSPGSGVPGRSEVRTVCDCPDADDPTRLCKHAVATMFTFANEVAIEPELLDLWRSRVDGEDAHRDAADEPLAEIIELFPGAARVGRTESSPDNVEQREQGHGEDDAHDDTDDNDTDDNDVDDDDDDEADEINAMLVAPNSRPGSPVDEFGVVTPIVHPSTGDRTVDRLIREMLDEVDIGW